MANGVPLPAATSHAFIAEIMELSRVEQVHPDS